MSDQFNIIDRSRGQAKKLLSENADRTGIADSIFTPEEIAAALQLVSYAAAQADADGRPWFVVASSEILYATPTLPADTTDLDAVYVFEIPSHRDRSETAREALKLLRVAKQPEIEHGKAQNLPRRPRHLPAKRGRDIVEKEDAD